MIEIRRSVLAVRIGVGLVMVGLWGCSDIVFTPAGYNRAVLDGLAKIPEASQIDEIFGKKNVDHFIGYSGDRNDCTWTTHVCFGGRYELTMQVDVQVNREFDEIVKVLGEPEFHLVKVRKITEDTMGAFYDSRFGKTHGHFDKKKWRLLYNAGGDFTAIGIPVDPSQPPIKGFDEFSAGMRRDRIVIER